MKKIIFLFVAVGFFAITAITKLSLANNVVSKNVTFELNDSKYKACIDACNVCVTSCKSLESMCSKSKDDKMARCMQLCKECVSICTASSQLMSLNSESAKEICAICAKICEKCATECEKCAKECDKSMMKDCTKCATECRNTAKLCKEI